MLMRVRCKYRITNAKCSYIFKVNAYNIIPFVLLLYATLHLLQAIISWLIHLSSLQLAYFDQFLKDSYFYTMA